MVWHPSRAAMCDDSSWNHDGSFPEHPLPEAGVARSAMFLAWPHGAESGGAARRELGELTG